MYACKQQGHHNYITSSIKVVTQPTAPSTAIHQASTDRHQQHSKEHNTQQPITQQHQRGTNNKTPTQGNNNNPVKGLVLLTLHNINILDTPTTL